MDGNLAFLPACNRRQCRRFGQADRRRVPRYVSRADRWPRKKHLGWL